VTTPTPLDLDALAALADAATEGPWFFDSYCRVSSAPKVQTYDDWSGPLLDAGHTLERHGQCDACPDRPIPEGRSPQLGAGCAHADEDYARDPLVAEVPPYAGDTAHGQRAADAEFIAAAPTALPELLAEVERLRAKLDMPCGSCHPCLNWPAETWKRAGRHLPDVHRFGEMEDERTQLRADVDALLPAAKLCLATLDADAPMNPAEALLVTTVRDVIARHGGSR
jgi:hypothetical protein